MAFSLQTGGLVGQRYRLVRLLGEGGMGAVWAATHVVTRKSVALKFLKGADSSRADVRRRFLREARAATAVRHPNVVEIHDIFELEDGSPVMVMDLLTGRSLGARLRQDKILTLPEVAGILLPVLSAVGTAHAMGIVHRDLKPDNIFLVEEDGKIDVRVLDFGIAKLTASEGDAASTGGGGLTQTGDMLGTPHYMAPEQATGEADIDQRVDVWALGVILYECLAGERPVQGNNLGQVLKKILTGAIVPLAEAAPQLPDDVKTLVASMLAHDREKRPRDLRPVHEVLRRYSDVEAPAFAEARPRAAAAVAPSGMDPYGATATPTKRELKKANDPRWQAATFSLEADRPQAASRARWPLWIGGAVVAAAAGVGLTVMRSPPVSVVVAAPDLGSPPPHPAAAPPDLATPNDLPIRTPVKRAPKHHQKAVEAPQPAPKHEPARLPGGVPEDPPY